MRQGVMLLTFGLRGASFGHPDLISERTAMTLNKTSKAALLAAGLLLWSSAAALAATATPEEAQRLTTLFQSYLGPEPGVVTVAPSGESYAAKFDFQPLFSKLNAQGVAITLTPLEMTLTPEGSGKWKVDQDQPLSLTVKAQGSMDMKAEVGSLKGSGIFDEAIGTFASSEAEYRNVALDQTITEQNQVARTIYTLETLKVTSTATAASDGVDAKLTQGYQNFRQTASIPAAPDGSAPAMEFTVTSPSGTQDVSLTGARLRPIMDVLAWAVAHPSPDSFKTGQAELKDKLRAALPVFSTISGTATMNEVSVNTIAGKFGIQKLDVAADMNGVVADGRLREAFTISGFSTPPELVPAWAAGMVPDNIKVDVNVSGFNLAAPAQMIIDKLDLAKDPPLPEGFENELIPALMPSGSVAIGLGASEILAKIYHLTAEGNMTAGPVDLPAGQALVKFKGLDETMAALQAAPPEFGMQQMGPLLLLVKGLGKQESDGYLSWKIESTPQGIMTVNGTDISKMMGGQ